MLKSDNDIFILDLSNCVCNINKGEELLCHQGRCYGGKCTELEIPVNLPDINIG